MVLVLNCMIDPRLADSFDKALGRPLVISGQVARFVRLSAGEEIKDTSGVGHIIISGSESSARDERPWNRMLDAVVRKAVAAETPLLGICYGHQFLARVLKGREHVRRSPTVEIGWARVRVLASSNSLFGGVGELVSMVSHYDEVIDVGRGDGFRILAETDRCAVHAFQYRDLPIWGVQFHPEYDRSEAEEIFAAIARDDPDATIDLDEEPAFDPSLTRQLLLNFLRQ